MITIGIDYQNFREPCSSETFLTKAEGRNVDLGNTRVNKEAHVDLEQ